MRATALARFVQSMSGARHLYGDGLPPRHHCQCCCYRGVVELKLYTSCPIVTVCDTSRVAERAQVRVQSSSGRCILDDTNRAREHPRSRGRPVTRWHTPTPLIRAILQLHLKFLCAFSGCFDVAVVPNLYDVEGWNDPPIKECEEHTHTLRTRLSYTTLCTECGAGCTAQDTENEAGI